RGHPYFKFSFLWLLRGFLFIQEACLPSGFMEKRIYQYHHRKVRHPSPYSKIFLWWKALFRTQGGSMNQRGEVISLSVLIILVMSSFLILCSLELRKDYKELKERAQLFICTKEFKGELEIFLTQIGKTNWAIKN